MSSEIWKVSRIPAKKLLPSSISSISKNKNVSNYSLLGRAEPARDFPGEEKRKIRLFPKGNDIDRLFILRK